MAGRHVPAIIALAACIVPMAGVAAAADDGIEVGVPDPTLVAWRAGAEFDTVNVYSGDLRVLRETGEYTQVPGSNPLAYRFCHLPGSSLRDGTLPAPGEALFYLASGNRDLVEGGLGEDGDGAARLNANPCPRPDGVEVTVLPDKRVYEPAEPARPTVLVTNGTSDVVTLQFGSSCQSWFSVLRADGTSLFDEAKHILCAAVLTSLTLQSGESRAYPKFWNQVDDAAFPAPVPDDLVIQGRLASWESVPPGEASIALRYPDTPFRLEVSTDKDLYIPGEVVEIRLYVTNMSDEPASLNFGGCQAHFSVETLHGETVFTLAPDCPPEPSRLDFRPWESIVLYLAWDLADDSGRQVTSGDYLIRGIIDSYETVPMARKRIHVDPHPFRISVKTDKRQYAPGEEARVDITVTNVSDETFTVEFLTGCQALFDVFDASGAVVYSLARHILCADGASRLTLEAGESRTYDFVWPQVDDAGDPVPAPADYYLVAFLDGHPEIRPAQILIQIR
jgi:hypothetical protein